MTRFEVRTPVAVAPMLAMALAVALATAPSHAQVATEKAGTPAPASEAPAAAPAAAQPPAKDGGADAAAAPKDAKPKNDASAAESPVPSGPLGPLAWLNGCWKGTVGAGAYVREFREYWHPPRGNLMVGVGHNAMRDSTVSYEYLRLEPRGGDVYYVVAQPEKPAQVFKLADTQREGNDHIFTFRKGGTAFPAYFIYRRATQGWLYVEVGGRLNQNGTERDHKVTYPFRRVDCETDEFIKK